MLTYSDCPIYRSITKNNKSNAPLRRFQNEKCDSYHKWVEWSEIDQVYIGKCPDLITGIHGDDPVAVYKELCDITEEVIEHLEKEGNTLPTPRTKPMMKVV